MKEMQRVDVGVVVGRFQVDELHEAHKELIQHVLNLHGKVFLFLGLSPCKCTVSNPLDFESRKQMILDCFPMITVMYITDTPSDTLWSERLDRQITELTGPNQSVLLYGGRESFIPYYNGRFETVELEPKLYVSGSDRRKYLSSRVKSSAEFRHGVIWATQNQYPKCFPTVDVAITDDRGRILLGKKKDEDKFRLIGGFVNPAETFESAAAREVKEESGVEVCDMEYVGSFAIDDWRYRSEIDKITTCLFTCNWLSGTPTPGDDICAVGWFELNKELIDNVVNNHKILINALLKRN